MFEEIWGMFPAILAAILLGIVLLLAFRRRSKDDILRDAAGARDIYNEVAAQSGLDRMRHRFHDDRTTDAARAELDRPMAKRSELAAGYGKPPARERTFTPRQLERVNIQRRLRGAMPLNRKGFQAAAAVATTYARQPETNSDWLLYFVMYQSFLGDHSTHRASCDHYLTIDPDRPFNGQGGAFGGAGAAGAWDDPAAGNSSPAPALAAGAAFAGTFDRPDGPLVGDGPGAAMAPEPGWPSRTPDYAFDTPKAVTDHRVGDPGPAAPPDTYSAPAETSAPSAPSDSGGSSGGDSGGGGGGGGD